MKRKLAFSQKAVDYGLPALKGVLILGLLGSGKNLTAKATAKVFGVPLLKLDAGKIFAGVVGQSESNLRPVMQTAEAIAPCVLWLVEVEKGFSGYKNNGRLFLSRMWLKARERTAHNKRRFIWDPVVFMRTVPRGAGESFFIPSP